jgi:predicted nucleic acid-binding protein
VPDDDLAGRALRWSQQLRHPAHDCFYLACADETGCHLVSGDPHLRQAGRVAGLTVLSLPEAVARLNA